MNYNEIAFFWFKAIVSGLIIALISQLAKNHVKWGALLTAFPLMTFLSLIWIYYDTKDLDLLYRYTRDVLVWIIPTILFFVVALILFRAQVPFLMTLLLSTLSVFAGIFIFLKSGWIK